MITTTDKSGATGKIDIDSGNPELSDRPLKIWDIVSKYLSQGDRVLDIGCGTGWVYDLWKGNYTGIDTWEEQILLNQKRCPNATFICSDVKVTKNIPPHDVLIEFGMNTYYGIESKDEVVFNSKANLILLEIPVFYGLERLFRIITELCKEKYKIAEITTIDTDARCAKRVVAVLSLKK